jgi:hypothetical protein
MMPWWFFGIGMIIAIGIFPWYLESFIIAALLDSVFAFPLELGFFNQHRYLIVIVGMVIVTAIIRRYTVFHIK